ncbi:hypothetical protein EA004_16220 [Vibrio anguillarum]|uniref:Pyrrolo-quinoline quinone repeat domain-containing protein n=5 Tax=Vibrio anguillarum TaxID=55601 RepID=A0ABR9Z6E3_VIBAN|nr:PQQ-binding-like beta-propeller repeat protein [Vibrio anguillarum]MBF4246561.1 hypothetical protein [Vibrio anguillarum]MBF4374024.1 hypothetical protein [Vibrio anguillarum]
MSIQNLNTSFIAINQFMAKSSLDLTNTEWNNQVTSSTADMTVIEKDQYLYVGTNGYVYQLNAKTGNLIDTNSLHKTHHNNILMAISDDGKYLYIGTDGYAICIDTNDFTNEVWRNEVSGTSKDVTMACHGDKVYAACNGYAYQLNAGNGKTIATNKLKRTHNHGVNLAISDDGSALYVGTDGYAIRINTNDFSHEAWREEVNSSSDIVTLLLKDDILYTACHNNAHKLDISSGKQLDHLSISDAHSKPLSLAITPDGKRLFIGVSGDVISVKTDQFSTQSWRISLTDEKSQVALLVDSETINTGCRGYLQQLDIDTGKTVFKNSFAGIGKNNVAMVQNEAQNQLYFASGGYVIAMDSVQQLNAGWDIVLAEKLTPMNEQLQALYDAQKLPKQVADIELGCPQVEAVNSQNQQQVTLSISAKGKMKKLFSVDGILAATLDLSQVDLNLVKQSDHRYQLQINLGAKVIKDIDLSQLKVKFIGKPIDIEQQHQHITELLNQVIEQIGTIELPINIALPLDTDKIKTGLAYVYNQEDQNNSFVALMLANDDTSSTSPLSANTIYPASDCDTALIISNLTIMTFVQNLLYQQLENQDLFVGDNFISLDADVYPARVSNNETSQESKYDCGAAVKIEKGQLNSQFSSSSELVTHLNLRYKEIIVKVSHTYYITVSIGLSAEDGKLHLAFSNDYDSCSGGTTCHYIKKAVKEALSEFEDLFSHGLTISLPAIDVHQVQSPGFIQICGAIKN